jgi:hypothetical protein
MDIQQLSIDLSLQKTQEQAAVRIQRMTLTSMKDQSAALMKMLESVAVITDPHLGNQINIFA